jgi:hypothetical protein
MIPWIIPVLWTMLSTRLTPFSKQQLHSNNALANPLVLMRATQASLLIHPGKINVIQEITIPTSPDQNKTYQERYAHTFKLSPKHVQKHSRSLRDWNRSNAPATKVMKSYGKYIFYTIKIKKSKSTTTLERTYRGNDFSNLISTYKLSKTFPKYPSSTMRHEWMDVMCEQWIKVHELSHMNYLISFTVPKPFQILKINYDEIDGYHSWHYFPF